jgi:hypothetical protein
MSEESWIQCCTYVYNKRLVTGNVILLAFYLGLANIPAEIVELAQSKALGFERWVTLKRILFSLKKVADSSHHEQDLLKIISRLKLN